jgi:hypothetical protein
LAISLTPSDIDWIKDPNNSQVTKILPIYSVPIPIHGSITTYSAWQAVQVTAITGMPQATNAATPTGHVLSLYNAATSMLVGSIVLTLILALFGGRTPPFSFS